MEVSRTKDRDVSTPTIVSNLLEKNYSNSEHRYRAIVPNKNQSFDNISVLANQHGAFLIDSEGRPIASDRKSEASTKEITNSNYQNIHEKVLWLKQTSPPRSWCLKAIQSDWFERVSMLVIFVNCITLGLHVPACDHGVESQQTKALHSKNFLSAHECTTERCVVLTTIDDLIFMFFALEMLTGTFKVCL